MTKIKNTKKGMAKKTLSMSLVVAMLATSNVPVWAAEFSDGSAAVATETPATETFSDDMVDAPSVDNTEMATSATSVVTETDINVNLTVDKKEITWGEKANITGTVTKKDGTALTGWKYRWLDDDNVSPKNGSATKAADMSLDTSTDGDKLAGKTLALYVYDDTGEVNYDIKTGITVTINKRTLNANTITLDSTAVSKLKYKGFTQSAPESIVISVKDSKNETVDAKNYIVTSESGLNKDDEIKITISAKNNTAYTGSIIKTVKILAKPYSPATSEYEGDIVATTTENQKFQYTGKIIEIPTENVKLKESESTNNGADGKLSGADLSAAITSAKTTAATVGDQTVTVTADTTKFTNFTGAPSTYTTKEKVSIQKRDLTASGTTISITNGKVKTGSTLAELSKVLKFKGTEGTDLTLNYGTDYTLKVSDPSGNDVTGSLGQTGTYTVTVTATANGNCTGSQTFSVTTVGNVLQNVTYSNSAKYAPVYTGSAITPSKDDLGTLTVTGTAGREALQASQWEITGYTNNTDAATYEGKVGDSSKIKTQAYVNVSILGGNYAGQTFAIPFVISPLTVSAADITVPETVTYNADYTKPEQYNIPVTVVAKDTSGKVSKILDAADYTVKYAFAAGPVINKDIKATVTITNKNYIMGSTNGKTFDVTASKATTMKAKALSNDMVKVNPSSYTYTGGKIVPTYAVVDGAIALYKGTDGDKKGEYSEVSISDAVNVGTGTITVEGINNFYSGKATGTFTITAANTADVKVEITNEKECLYTGKQVRPRTFKATLNGNDVTNQFEIVSYGENVEAGKGTIVLKVKDGNKNFTGDNITVEFNIVKEQVKGSLKLYNDKGIDITNSATDKVFTFDGNEKTFSKVLLSGLTKTDNTTTTAKVSDFEIKYADNITGNKNIAYVYAVAKDGTGFAGSDTITTADGTIIKGVVAKIPFRINSVYFYKQNVSIKNATYAAGLPVKPEVLIQIGGSTLVEGKDYKLELISSVSGSTVTTVTPVDTTVGKIYGIKVTGINGYNGSNVISTYASSKFTDLSWGVDKKNLKDCKVTVKDGVVSVVNGYIPVASTEYTSKNNGDGTYTVSAVSTSKNYTGSVTVKADGKAEDEKPDAPMISSVKVVGNNATAILSGDSDGAAGYDYVISTDRDCITNKDYDSVNKNQVQTSTTFKYVQQGTYYAYCHAWKRDENGKKVFSDWSNAYPFVVSAITPDAPVITNVKVSGSTIKVTYKAAANATGYDVVLGTSSKKENGETRPYHYGNHKVLNLKEGTVTATFKNVPKGTWTVGMHAFNRTSEDGKKVFSPWSNLKKATVK